MHVNQISRKIQKELRRKPAREAAEKLHVIPRNKEQHLQVVLISRKSPDHEWGVRSRLFEINFKLSEGTYTQQQAMDVAYRKIDMWQRCEPFSEFKALWRYTSTPMIRPTPAREEEIKKRNPKAKKPKLTLDDL